MRQAPVSNIRVIWLLVGMAMCTACGGDTNPQESGTVPNALLGSDAESIPRQLEFSESSTEVKSIVQCFCDSRYRSTLQIIHFINQNAVLTIEFDNLSLDFNSAAVLHLFDQTATQSDLSRWINNQHSDGLYLNTAIPTHSIELGSSLVTVTSSAFVESLSGFSGDEYDKYQIDYSVANQSATGLYFLNGFSSNADVYLQTSGPSL